VASTGSTSTARATNLVTFGLVRDLDGGQTSLRMREDAERTQDVLKLAAAFGRQSNHGWEFSGPSRSDLSWTWQPGQAVQVTGAIRVQKGILHAAGLNLPLEIADATINWNAGLRTVKIEKAEGFGAQWSGEIAEKAQTDSENGRW